MMISEYSPDWKSIRKRILARANYCCEGCGIPNHHIFFSISFKGQTFWCTTYNDFKELYTPQAETKEVAVVLTIAHLDHDETNHDVEDDRLMAICQVCHLAYDAAMLIDEIGIKEALKKTRGNV